MLFHNPEFLIGFLPVVLCLFFVLSKVDGRIVPIAWLTVASLVFYAWGTAAHLGLIIGSVLFNYGAAQLIGKMRAQGRTKAVKTTLGVAVAANLVCLGTFKYADFFVRTANDVGSADLVEPNLILPLAISFFTLQQIAFLVDVARGETDEPRFLHYCLFITFFPQLIAGPIVHHKEMIPQFSKPGVFRFDFDNFSAGMTIFLLGVFKKVILADSMSGISGPVFDAAADGHPVSLFAAWAGTVGYSLEIYFDFSAYSDMAIGLARMFSIRLPLNFNSPYLATSIIDFWRRWHITLSRFLRDYLYFPLGGNRRGEVRRYTNLMLTMLIGGLWHGASWNFVIWGGVHGLLLVLNHSWLGLKRRAGSIPALESRTFAAFSVFVTFGAVTVAWVFFRAQDFPTAYGILSGLIGRNGAVLPAQLIEIAPFLGLVASSGTGVPFFGGGTVLGFMESSGLLAVGLAIVFFPRHLHVMSQRTRLVLLLLTFGFTLRSLVYGVETAFIYFRF